MRLALAGDTMLGRGVAEAIRAGTPLFSGEVVDLVHQTDLFLLNLECCISARGERWPDPSKPFFFRAPPEAAEVLAALGVDCVTLANNHALDYGAPALLDTLRYLGDAGIEVAGAGVDRTAARQPAFLERDGFRLRVVGVTDHPVEFAASPDSPGVAFADFRDGVPAWLVDTLSESADPVLVAPHWGPNMTEAPVAHVRRTAHRLMETGAALVAGHSAHVFHGVSGRVIYDMGDFIDDYAVDPWLRNDLGLLFFVDLGPSGPVRLEAVPIALDFCHTRLATGSEKVWIEERFVAACGLMGTGVERAEDRLIVTWEEQLNWQ